MADWHGINITDGTDRDSRLSPALLPGYFNVDELTFEQLLTMGAEFASFIKFYNLKNEVNGNWAEMFSADEAVIMAMILSADLKKIESEFARLASGRPDRLTSFVLRCAQWVDFWHSKLKSSQHKSGVALAQKIAAFIEDKLTVELHNVAEIASRLEMLSGQNDSVDLSAFDRIWQLSEEEGVYYFPKSTVSELETGADIKLQLRSSFYVFYNAVSYLKTITPIYLQESLGSQQHNPAMGLFMVFLKLYGKAQQRLNTFTQRHLDFYYDKFLKFSPRPPVPESVYLLFEAQPGVDRALVKKQTEFTAGKDAQLNEILYCAESDLIVTDAKVEALATLHLQYDKLISPASEFYYVTRIKSDRPAMMRPDAERQQLPWPLMGVWKENTQKGTAADARMGFAVASPLLLLKEGTRKIELAIELDDVGEVTVDSIIALFLGVKTKQEFIRLFGKLFARYMLGPEGCLSLQDKQVIIGKAQAILPKNLADEVDQLLMQDWQGLFYRLFKKIFRIKLTAESGWLEAKDYIIVPFSEAIGTQKTGLKIVLNLGQEVEPVTAYAADIHGGELDTLLPVLQCYINPQTNFYPYSLFNDLVIKQATIEVDVKGVKDIQAYNQHGQLDPSKPFNPFGPLPGTNSYFVIGNYELARKRLVGLSINLEWGDLPPHPGGFAEYYSGYESDYDNASFKGELSALADGNWQPYDNAAKQYFTLFESEPDSAKLAEDKHIDVSVLDYTKPIDSGISEEEYQYTLKARNGYLRLSLAEPETAFGHAIYPSLLTKVLSANAKLKKPKQTPNPPYTPILNRISLDYKARSEIEVALKRDSYGMAEKIYHLHPFGVEQVHPTGDDKPCYLLPQYRYEGNLFIGLSAKNLSGYLTLFFHLSEDFGHQENAEPPAVSWFYLSSGNWRPLSAKRVLSDTTSGFLSSGIVTLDIPADIDRDSTVMPNEYFWLRVSAGEGVDSLCSAYAVQAHAVKAGRKKSEQVSQPQTLPAIIKWNSMVNLPGIDSIRQGGSPFGGRAGENDSDFRTRISERLRHKNRALTPWDYERLILERFSHVRKVKCFSNVSSVHHRIKPGTVLIVPVPEPQTTTAGVCARASMSSIDLNQIKTYVQQLSSPFAEIEVRNPVYERVQVRCTVKFVAGVSDGVYINRLNQAIADYICPWKQTGYQAKFGWTIKQKDIESYIRSLSYVDFVTNFSMLHITVDNEGRYHLFDTAKYQQNSDAQITPRYPWSLAIPVQRHFIETIKKAHSIKPEITGVNELEVGSTFIISGNNDYGEEE